MAKDLTAAATLAGKYQATARRFPVRAGSTGHNVVKQIKQDLRNAPGAGSGNLTKFQAWAQQGDWGKFGPAHSHYDWWMFPIDRESSQGAKYTVYQDGIDALKSDAAWLQDYRLGATLLVASWGWDIKAHQLYTNPGPEQAWNGYDVRLGKLAHSLILFQQWDLYEGLKQYTDLLKHQGVRFESWVDRYLQ